MNDLKIGSQFANSQCYDENDAPNGGKNEFDASKRDAINMPVMKRKCFNSIQQRRFWTTICDASISLCPSMDLISFGASTTTTTKSETSWTTLPTDLEEAKDLQGFSSTSIPMTQTISGSTSIQLHRTVNWQKLATATVANTSDSYMVLQTHAVWRPDGRFLAIADTIGRVSVYSVENMLNSAASNSNSTIPMASTNITASTELSNFRSSEVSPGSDIMTGDDLEVASKVILITLPKPKPINVTDAINTTNQATITGLSWSHVGKNHPAWPAVRNGLSPSKESDTYCVSDDSEDDDFAVEYMWKHRSQFVDREMTFLPRSQYHVQSNLVSSAASCDSPLPGCQTPLSILYITTMDSGYVRDQSSVTNYQKYLRHYLNVYLHGRYSIATELSLGDTKDENCPVDLVLSASADLTHLIISGNFITQGGTTQSGPLLRLYSIPGITKNRYTFQQISTFYSKICTHLHAIQSNINGVVAMFKAALKPLDLKMEALYKLLQNYGLIDGKKEEDDDATHSSLENHSISQSMRPLLVQYILSGHTRNSPNLSNAIDQFFTSPQMNDQLLLRMDRSLATAVSNVESTLKQNLLAPAMALHYSVDALYGLAKYRTDMFSSSLSTETPSGETKLDQLVLSTQLLLVSIETALNELLDARFRLRDFVSWLRATGSQIKAQGTAPKSVQRDNAKKRRIPDIVVHRMLSYFSQEQDSLTDSELIQNVVKVASTLGTTEGILALKLVPMLNKELDFVCNDPGRPLPEMQNNEKDYHQPTVNPIPRINATIRTTPTVPHVLKKLVQDAESVFECPREYVRESICRTTLRLLPVTDTSSKETRSTGLGKIALTTRLGGGGCCKDQQYYFGEPKPSNFFVARTTLCDTAMATTNSRQPCAESFRQWSVIAYVCGPNKLLLVAVPLTWTSTNDTDCDYTESFTGKNASTYKESGIAAPFHWSCLLEFPKEFSIKDVNFYGDDGKSTLLSSSSDNNATGEEGRQAVGVLMSCPKFNSSDVHSLELWMLNYDSLLFSCVPLESSSSDSGEENERTLTVCCDESVTRPIFVQAMTSKVDEEMEENYDRNEEEDEFIVTAKTRTLGVTLSSMEVETSTCRLVLSGSRGIGAVFVNESGCRTSMELLDLEDDDDDNDVEDDMELANDD